jgi:hypothetical protein
MIGSAAIPRPASPRISIASIMIVDVRIRVSPLCFEISSEYSSILLKICDASGTGGDIRPGTDLPRWPAWPHQHQIERSRRWTSQCSFAGFSLCRPRSSPRVLSGRPSSSGGGILSACPRSVFDGRWSTTRGVRPGAQHIRRPSCLAKNAVQICFLGSPFSGDCGGSVSGNLPL